MGNSDSKPRRITVENPPIFISDDLRDRLGAAAASSSTPSPSSSSSEPEFRPIDAERSPDDVRSPPTAPRPSKPSQKPGTVQLSPDDRLTLGEETAMALLRMREERDRELDRMQREYFEKIRKAEEDFANINKLKDEEYSKAVAETAALFPPLRMAACKDMEKSVLDCYKSHPTETLSCHGLVSRFHDCVASTRVREAVSRKTVPVRSG